MANIGVASLVKDFLGASHVFATAMNDVLEEELLHEAAEGQLTVSQMKLLKLVSLTEAQTIGDVAAFMRVSKAAASKAVDRLARRMLLRRSPGITDRRAIHLSLTEPSRRLLARYDAARERKLEEIFGLSLPAGLDHLSDLLDSLSARILILNESARPGQLCLQCGVYFRENCLLRTQLNRKCFHLRPQASTGEVLQVSK